MIICCFSHAIADDLDPHYKFSGVKAPDSPYKNTWGAFQTNLFSGSFSYDYKIVVLPGTNGLAPQISISYNSHSAKGKAGWVGAGWDIPLSYIQRDIEYTRKDTSDDTFDLFLEGAKHDLVYVASENLYHTKVEAYLRIEKKTGAPNARNEYWVATTKDGTEYRFGYNADSENSLRASDSSLQGFWAYETIAWQSYPSPEANTIPIYRFSNAQIGDHFYTASEDERQALLSNPSWQYEGIAWYAYSTQQSDTAPVYRFWNAQIGDHFYTVDEAERAAVLSDLAWVEEGVAWYTHLQPQAGTVPVYRFYSSLSQDHFYTISEQERATLIQQSPNYVWRWSLDRIKDSNGNCIYFTYVEDQGSVYLDTIAYNNDMKRTIQFVRELKSDAYLIIEQGSEVYEAYRLSEILIRVNGVLARKYKLDYTVNESQNKSLLASITQYGADGVSALPPVRFEYKTLDKSFGTEASWYTPGERWIRKVDTDTDTVVDTFDVNGDGLSDLVSYDESGGPHWDIWFNNKTGFSPSNVRWAVPSSWSVRQVQTYNPNVPAQDQSPDTKSSPLDFNRDGYVDFLYAHEDTQLQVQMNNSGTGFIGVPDRPLPTRTSIREVQKPDGVAANVKEALMDINGDGLPDVVIKASSTTWQIWRNTGSGFADFGVWNVPHPNAWIEDFTRGTPNVEVSSSFDMNGDGLPDIIDSAGGTWKIWLNTGSNFIYGGDWPTAFSGLITDLDTTGNVKRDVIDINGDGLPDIVNPPNGSSIWEVQFNTGKGFTGKTLWQAPAQIPADGFTRDVTTDGNIRRDVFDIDGDNVPDIVRKTDTDWKVYTNKSGQADLLTQVTDTLGGIITANYTQSMSFANTRLPFNYWVVSSLTTNNGMSGAHSNISTTNFSYTNGLYDYPTREFRGFGQVNEVKADGSKATHYYYQDETKKGKEYKTEIKSTSNAPFASTENAWNESLSNGVYISNLSRTDEYTYDGNSSGSKIVRKEYQDYDVYGNIGLQINYGDINAYSEEGSAWYSYSSPQATTIPIYRFINAQIGDHFYTASESERQSMLSNPAWQYEGIAWYAYSTQQPDTVPVYRFWNAQKGDHFYTANEAERAAVLSDPAWVGEGIAWYAYPQPQAGTVPVYRFYSSQMQDHFYTASEQERSTIQGSETYTYNDYWPACSSDPWVVDRVRHSYIKSSPSSVNLRESFLWYDGLTTCVTKGNLTKEEHWLNTGNNPITTYEYDAYGNRTRTTDPEGRVTRAEYDPVYNTFPDKTRNAKNQLTQRITDPVNGEPTYIIDPNGFTTHYMYDVFYRKVKEIRPYDSETLPTINIQYLIDGTAPEHVIASKRELNGQNGTLDTVQVIDGMGNLIQTKTEYETPANMIAVDVYYDEMGRVKKQSIPYLTNNAYAYSTPNTAAPSTVYDYDDLDRPTRITNPDGLQINRTFDHWTVTETDENWHVKAYKFDAFQRLLQVTENNAGASYYTNYLYSPLGELNRITDHPGNITTIQYDTLGRKTTMQDPDMGRWSYSYDRVGNLSSQTDARGIVTNIQYDELNRKKMIDYRNDADVAFTYDTGTIGTLSQVVDSSGTVDYQYDERLRRTQETRALDGLSWTTRWSYDALDRVVSQIYPGGEAVAFNYNNQGLLDSMPGILNTLDYNEHGRIIQKGFANSLNTVFSYYSGNQRLHTISTPGIQAFTYTYDNVGNVKSIVDNAVGRTENFSYDDLDRLTQAGDSGYSSQYQYNAIGNILSMIKDGQTTNYSYGANAGPHAVTGMTAPYLVLGSFALDNGNEYTTTGQVMLNNIPYGTPAEYMASEDEAFSVASWQPYSPSPVFPLSHGYGRKTVYFKLRDANGETKVKADSIDYLLDTDGDSIPDKYDDDDDGDGMPDTWESDNGFNPLDSSDGQADADTDGLTNLEEFQHHTDPHNGDTDNDGWGDYEEIFSHGTDPTDSDTDDDGLIDPGDPYPTNPYHDGFSENYRMTAVLNEGGDMRSGAAYKVQDRIGDGISRKTFVDTDDDGIPDNDDQDDDNDGIPDVWELAHGMDPLDYTDASADFDDDGLTNLQEYQYGTNLNNHDTDGDGADDYTEIFIYKSDPLDQDTDDDGLNDSIDPAPTNIYHYGLSENYSLRKGNFNEGGGHRSESAYSVTDKIGNEFGDNSMSTQLSPIISVSPLTVDFSSVIIGTQSVVSIAVSNNGTGNLTIGSIVVAGSNNEEFSTQNDSCSGRTLSPSGQCTFEVIFSPASAGAKSAELNIPSNDPASSEIVVSLSGTGLDYHIFGSGYNYPEPSFRASMALDVQASALGTSWLNYYYSKLRLSFVSTLITGISVSGDTITIVGEGTVNGVPGYTFEVTITDGDLDSMRIVIYNPDGSVYFDSGSGALSGGDFNVAINNSTQYQLTTHVSPSGSGNVTPDCSAGCLYDDGTFAVLSAGGNGGYSFFNWTGCDAPSNNLCTMTMESDKSLTANFQECPQPVRISGAIPVYYSTLQAAYDAATDGDIIQSRGIVFTDDLNANRNISVDLEGGYNCDYSTRTGKTTLNGTITINNGVITIEDFELK